MLIAEEYYYIIYKSLLHLNNFISIQFFRDTIIKSLNVSYIRYQTFPLIRDYTFHLCVPTNQLKRMHANTRKLHESIKPPLHVTALKS